MKNGANKFDLEKITKMANEGLTAEEISQRLAIYPDVVKRFMPKPAAAAPKEETANEESPKPKAKPKAKAKSKKSAKKEETE